MKKSLKNNISWCKKCCDPTTRPDCIHDAKGVCFPCRVAEKQHLIDWNARKKEIEEIAEWGKAHNKSGYDCIVAVSGGKDSIRQSLYVRDELGMNALLVACVYPPEQQTERGAANVANICKLGFDLITVAPAPETTKKLNRISFLKFGHICKATEYSLYASVPRIATSYHIPLIFYGENPTLSWGSSGGSFDGDANNLKSCNTLRGGVPPGDFLDDGITMRDLFMYIYPSDAEMKRAGLRLVYLGYYIKDFNDDVNGKVALENGITPRTGDDAAPDEIGQIRNYDALDEDFVIVNQMIKRIKFGFGKVAEQCSGSIRAGSLTRKKAVELINKYDGRCHPRFIRKFCKHIGISEDEFWSVVERYRNKNLWLKDEKGEWILKYPIS